MRIQCLLMALPGLELIDSAPLGDTLCFWQEGGRAKSNGSWLCNKLSWKDASAISGEITALLHLNAAVPPSCEGLGKRVVLLGCCYEHHACPLPN